MRTRSTIFGSRSEATVFRALETRWSEVFDLYPNLPLANILQLERSDQLPRNERDFFYQTTVDFTFCQRDGVPLFSVEFDGLGGGYSCNGTYWTGRSAPTLNRQWKLGIKAKWAHALFYPLLIVSFEEARDTLDQDTSLTILDGIVGQFLTSHRGNELAWIRIKDVGPGIGHEEAVDIFEGARIQAQYESDPLVSEVDRLQQHCRSLGVNISTCFSLGLGSGYRSTFLWETMRGGKLEVVRSRSWLGPLDDQSAVETARRVGCRIVMPTSAGPLFRTVWLRNVGGMLVSMPQLAELIALYTICKQASEMHAAVAG